LTNEILLGITILSTGGRTSVPKPVMEMLKLNSSLRKKEKILWTQEGDDIIVRKGSPRSSFRKTKLSTAGKAAVPRHARAALNLRSTPSREDMVVWLQKGDEIIVRKAPHPIPID
jgi:hypothetical protein